MPEPEDLKLQTEGNPHQRIIAENFTPSGDITGTNLEKRSVELALVTQSAQAARDFLLNKQWALLWRDADLLFQSPRPMTVYENTLT